MFTTVVSGKTILAAVAGSVGLNSILALY